MNTQLSQNHRRAILQHLVKYGSIEHREAREQYGCEALRSRISELRRAGIPIGDKIVKFTSRHGHPGWCKKYLLDKEEYMDNAIKLLIQEVNERAV